MKFKKRRTRNNLLEQEIPTHLAFIIMLVLSFLVVWLTVNTGEEIIRNAQKSPTFNFQKRMLENNIQIDKKNKNKNHQMNR